MSSVPGKKAKNAISWCIVVCDAAISVLCGEKNNKNLIEITKDSESNQNPLRRSRQGFDIGLFAPSAR